MGERGCISSSLSHMGLGMDEYRAVSTASRCFLPQLWLQALPSFTCVRSALGKHEGCWQPLWGPRCALEGLCPAKGRVQRCPRSRRAGQGNDGDGARTALGAARGWKPPQERRAGQRSIPGLGSAAPGAAAAGAGPGRGRRRARPLCPPRQHKTGGGGGRGRTPRSGPGCGPGRAGRRGGCSAQHRGQRRGRPRPSPGPWLACSRARSSSSRSSGEAPSKPWPRRDPRASSWPASPPASRCPGKGKGGGGSGRPCTPHLWSSSHRKESPECVPRHQQFLSGGAGAPCPCLRLGDAGWLSPLPGQVLCCRAALGNFGSVVLGAWEQGEGLQSSSWATERGQCWGASAGKCGQLHARCAEPWGGCPAGGLASVSALHPGPLGR